MVDEGVQWVKIRIIVTPSNPNFQKLQPRLPLKSKDSSRLVLGFPSTKPGYSKLRGPRDSPGPSLSWFSGFWKGFFFSSSSSLSVVWRIPETKVEDTSFLVPFFRDRIGQEAAFQALSDPTQS